VAGSCQIYQRLRFQEYVSVTLSVVVIATSNPVEGAEEGKHAPRNIKQVADPPRSLQVEVLSSKSKVSVTIDGTMVSDSAVLKTNCGLLFV